MLEDRGKMPLPHVFLVNENIKLIVMGRIVGVASSHELYAPQCNVYNALSK